ncbi:MAG: hypothetical protein LBU61_01505 [Coriobacteriales bacterium]|jgi:hypothetical protein|nr:hypothetical protein [Coriobacteriales bacterium]
MTSQAVPDWAQFFTDEQYRLFLQAVHDYFTEQQIECQVVDDKVVVSKDTAARLWNVNDDIELGLYNLAHDCNQQNTTKYKQNVYEYFDRVLQTITDMQSLDSVLHDFSQAEGYIGVRIYSHEYISSITDKALLTRELVSGLLETLVFDLPEAVRPIGAEEAWPWGRFSDELFDIGKTNISRNYSFTTEEVDVEGDMFYVLSAGHFFAANLVYELQKYERLAGDERSLAGDSEVSAGERITDLDDAPDPQPGALVGQYGSLIAFPTREISLIYPINDPSVMFVWVKLLQITRELYSEGPGSLSASVYHYRAGRLFEAGASKMKISGESAIIMNPLIQQLVAEMHEEEGQSE